MASGVGPGLVWALTVTHPAGRVGWQGALSWWEPSWEGAGLGLDTNKLASGLGGVKELRVGEGTCVHG